MIYSIPTRRDVAKWYGYSLGIFGYHALRLGKFKTWVVILILTLTAIIGFPVSLAANVVGCAILTGVCGCVSILLNLYVLISASHHIRKATIAHGISVQKRLDQIKKKEQQTARNEALRLEVALSTKEKVRLGLIKPEEADLSARVDILERQYRDQSEILESKMKRRIAEMVPLEIKREKIHREHQQIKKRIHDVESGIFKRIFAIGIGFIKDTANVPRILGILIDHIVVLGILFICWAISYLIHLFVYDSVPVVVAIAACEGCNTFQNCVRSGYFPGKYGVVWIINVSIIATLNDLGVAVCFLYTLVTLGFHHCKHPFQLVGFINSDNYPQGVQNYFNTYSICSTYGSITGEVPVGMEIFTNLFWCSVIGPSASTTTFIELMTFPQCSMPSISRYCFSINVKYVFSFLIILTLSIILYKIFDREWHGLIHLLHDFLTLEVLLVKSRKENRELDQEEELINEKEEEIS